VTPPDLIVITDDALSDDEIEQGMTRILDAVPPASTALQLRDRRRTARALLARAVRLRSLLARYGAPLIVNDRVDIAIEVGADGVHLGGQSIDVRDARAMLGEGVFLSVAAHELEDIDAARAAGATAALVAPIYATPGKGAPRGLDFLRAARARSGALLVYALGGIDAARVPECARAGARGVAAIRSMWSAGGAKAASDMVACVRAHSR
jgi:thiamine-phosphate pyrophosphorylase